MWIALEANRLLQSYSPQRRAKAQNVSFRISLRWPIHIINPVDKTILLSSDTYGCTTLWANSFSIF